MFNRLTEKARRVIVLAKDEAHRLNHDSINTEHLLMGLTHIDEGVASAVFEQYGITEERTREEVNRIVSPGKSGQVRGDVPFTPHAKRVLEFSAEEARNLRTNYIGTEHLLIGLLRESEGAAAAVLQELGLDLKDCRNVISTLLGVRLDAAICSIEGFSEEACNAVRRAHKATKELKHSAIGTGHLLLALVHEKDGMTADIISRLKVNADTLRKELGQSVSQRVADRDVENVPFTYQARRALELAVLESRFFLEKEAGTEHLLLGVLKQGEANQYLLAIGIDPTEIRDTVIEEFGKKYGGA